MITCDPSTSMARPRRLATVGNAARRPSTSFTGTIHEVTLEESQHGSEVTCCERPFHALRWKTVGRHDSMPNHAPTSASDIFAVAVLDVALAAARQRRRTPAVDSSRARALETKILHTRTTTIHAAQTECRTDEYTTHARVRACKTTHTYQLVWVDNQADPRISHWTDLVALCLALTVAVRDAVHRGGDIVEACPATT